MLGVEKDIVKLHLCVSWWKIRWINSRRSSCLQSVNQEHCVCCLTPTPWPPSTPSLTAISSNNTEITEGKKDIIDCFSLPRNICHGLCRFMNQDRGYDGPTYCFMFSYEDVSTPLQSFWPLTVVWSFFLINFIDLGTCKGCNHGGDIHSDQQVVWTCWDMLREKAVKWNPNSLNLH